ncbi:MAG: sigma-70 family RNA polymerase sigma factor [Candidatus Thiodiazotropha sp.]|jgi:RNA polymerase sigma-70 factor, ECF subfamily
MSTTTQTLDHNEVTRRRDERLRHLLAACASKDKIAFADLYESTSAKLFGLLLRILKRHDTAEDCLQEVYLKIWNKAGEYKPYAAAPMTWMSSIARYQAIDLLRRDKREVTEADTSGIADQIDLDRSPEEHAAALTEEKMLDHCIGQLKSEHRQVFVLAYFKGLTHVELAQQAEIPVGTVKTWIRRGLETLKRCLEP